ncbi:MAG: hypothetical protein HY236_12190 [Acidobacteria bacterium]|nr:hypothetical protein [Acidobacteriota bacterium]
MKCRNCGRNLTSAEAAGGRCPHCGRALEPASGSVLKTLSVRVASAEGDRVYHSLDEIPPETRQKLRQALNSPEAETIIIADEQGRERIFQAIRGLPPPLQKKLMAVLGAAPSPPPSRPSRNVHILRIALAAAAGASVALLLLWMWFR